MVKKFIEDTSKVLLLGSTFLGFLANCCLIFLHVSGMPLPEEYSITLIILLTLTFFVYRSNLQNEEQEIPLEDHLIER